MAKTSKPVAPAAPQPPYIKRAHLRNVPPLRDVKVDFKSGLNIIIGKNGSGKTNFMKLLSELADLYGKKERGTGSELILAYDGHDMKALFKESEELAQPIDLIFLASSAVENQSLYLPPVVAT